MNQYDTTVLEAAFLDRGYRKVHHHDRADVYVVNSCSVTARSEAKARQAVRRFRRLHPPAIIALVGCYVQANAQSARELDSADILVGTGTPHAVVEEVERALGREGPAHVLSISPEQMARVGERSRAQLKIQDGCDAFCTYCIVPLARGPVRSRPFCQVVSHARSLLEAGYREIVISGVRLGSYGRDLKDADLARLIACLDDMGHYRLRLSSIEPEDVTTDLMDALGRSRVFCHHLHLPLQSGSDRVLARMGRRYRSEDYRLLVEQLRNALGDVAVSTDVIVGFPGETEEDFADTCQLVRDMGFSRLHVFRFSPRPQTAAAHYDPKVPPGVQKERSAHMLALGARLSEEYHHRYLGRTVEILVEEPDSDSMLVGFTRDYVRVRFGGHHDLSNHLVDIKINAVDADGMWGELAPGSGAR